MASSQPVRERSTIAGPRGCRAWALLLLLGGGLGCRPSDFDELGTLDPASTAEAGSETGPDDASVDDADAHEAGEARDAAAPVMDGGEPSDGASDDAAEARDAQMDGAPGEAAPPDDAPGDAAQPTDAAPGAAAEAGPTTLMLPIASDRDDALWRTLNGELEELLHFSAASHGSDGYTIEVGVDGEQCRAGLRFALPLEPGSRVLAARLQLFRVGRQGDADPGSTMRVQVYDSASVGPFDHAHMHQDPAQHASGGAWAGASVGGFPAGRVDTFTQSEDLSELVQHVIDRPDWAKDGYIGFLLTPDQMDGTQYAELRDSFEGTNPPSLTITFERP